MIIRIARIFALVLMFNMLLAVGPAIGAGFSSPKLFPVSNTETKKSQPMQSTSQPSTLDKMSWGTKKFFSSVGDALTFKRSTPAKKSTTPSNPWIKPPKEQPKSSWLTSMFPKEEPKKPSSPSEWLQQKRLNP